jgi:uncharacterized membrane protein
MTMLYAGLALFMATHLLLSLAPAAIDTQRSRLGEAPVKGLIALPSLAGIVLIVMGWRAAEATWIYTPPAGARLPGLLLVALGIYLFVVANRPSRIKRLIRHPQLTGLVSWCAGHLLLNGDSRSLALFGSFAVWALVEIVLINRRDGHWEKPEPAPLATDLTTAAISLVALLVLAWAHPWLAGVAILPAS